MEDQNKKEAEIKENPLHKSANQGINNEEFEKLKKERDEYLDGWKRAKADFINHKKEEAVRAEVIVKFSNESMLRDLITVMDSFDLSIASLEVVSKDSPLLKGVSMTRSQMENMLKKYGLEPIKSLGQKFDPNLHEILFEVESEKPEGTIVEEIERGWKLYEKVVRPARVKVSK